MNTMATEAHKLIGLSLTKIAQSRMNRGGISLHKNLLVATVLQKARYVFMEEAYAAASYANNSVQVQPHTEVETRIQFSAPNTREERVAGRRVHKRRRQSEPTEDADTRDTKRWCADERLQSVEVSLSRVDASSSSDDSDDDCEEPMEVDRITSLVSVYSFGNSSLETNVRLSRTVSTPDLCSAQAKEFNSLQRRTVVAMAV